MCEKVQMTLSEYIRLEKARAELDKICFQSNYGLSITQTHSALTHHSNIRSEFSGEKLPQSTAT
jgi:hypothetical protein